MDDKKDHLGQFNPDNQPFDPFLKVEKGIVDDFLFSQKGVGLHF
jgi:hypothetical protein